MDNLVKNKKEYFKSHEFIVYTNHICITREEPIKLK